MFGFFNDPFDDLFVDPFDEVFNPFSYHHPRYHYVYRPRYVNDYFTLINNRLNQVLSEEFGINPHHPHIDILKRAKKLEHQKQLDAQDHSAIKEKIVHEAKEEALKTNDADHKLDENQSQNSKSKPSPYHSPYQSLFFESHSSYNGQNYVEEHRERVHDSDGKVHVTTRRRLGDRWYEATSITDEEGKTSTKETWHNVPEDQIEHFKQEWAMQHQSKYAPIANDQSKKDGEEKVNPTEENSSVAKKD
ncbi:hypothetical protein TRFO_34013 [Tritrichomonas foetus]|uniref:Uncharacterized protein n=1 Tax=Tritrichomonas foetus TaxID=1144522 RepID=A0A1J4JQN6_9EUKA|nr:hypothetical protein TRFO_34013 [Tritrichomonas foetus]|eukprot:OHS99548.1 hypothetical protein TRFO_34013 [Tritrichomonas foetus]